MNVNWKNVIVTVSLVAAMITGIALWETNTFSRWGKAGIVLGVFFAPNFMFRLYRMWETRERLHDIYVMSQMQFAAIKANKRQKEKNKMARGKK